MLPIFVFIFVLAYLLVADDQLVGRSFEESVGGEHSVEVIEDTKIPNAATIKIVKQDHTLGNMLRAYVASRLRQLHYLTCATRQLLSMPQVLFAGYKVPHPLHPYFLIKVQTDGSVTPTAIVEQACQKLLQTLANLEAKFKREFTFKDVDGVVQEGPYGPNAETSWPGQRDYLDF